MKFRVKLISVDLSDILRVYNGEFVEGDDLDKIFENHEDIYRFFENELVLGAIVDAVNKKAYIVTVSTASTLESPFTTLSVWTAEIE
jgi:hypothetical protein